MDMLAVDWIDSAARAVRTTIACACVVASLLAFPSVVPFTIAAWLVWYTIRVWRGKSAWWILVLAAGIVVVKRLDWPPALLALGGVAAVVICAELWITPRLPRELVPQGNAGIPKRRTVIARAGAALIWISWI